MNDDLLKILLEQNDYNNLLYHYTSFKTGVEGILSQRKLKFSSLSRTNDPFESMRSYPITVWTNENEKDWISKSSTGIEAIKILYDKIRIACFCKDNVINVIKEKHQGYNINDFNPIYYRGWAKLRMWIQYAESNNGFCFIFDKDKLLIKIEQYLKDTFDFAKEDILIDDINYDDNLLDYLDANIVNADKKDDPKTGKERIIKYARGYIFTKIRDFIHEQEIRIAIYLDQFTRGEELYIPYCDSLIGVIIGCKFPHVYLPSVEGLVNRLSIKLFEIDWDAHLGPQLSNIRKK